jgi:hypothetical protein
MYKIPPGSSPPQEQEVEAQKYAAAHTDKSSGTSCHGTIPCVPAQDPHKDPILRMPEGEEEIKKA